MLAHCLHAFGPLHYGGCLAVAFNVANLSQPETHAAINTAQVVFQTYKTLTNRRQKKLLREWTDLVRANRDYLAAICTVELRKPITEPYATVGYGSSFLEWFQCEIERLYADSIPAARSNNTIITVEQPQGVVAAIAPWNFARRDGPEKGQGRDRRGLHRRAKVAARDAHVTLTHREALRARQRVPREVPVVGADVRLREPHFRAPFRHYQVCRAPGGYAGEALRLRIRL